MANVSKIKLWTSYVLSALPALALCMSSGMKLAHASAIEEGFKHLGWQPSVAFTLGLVELSCILLYLFPKTSYLGAILVTGYLGGAIATHARIGEPFIIQFFLGVFVWGGLYLRDPRLQELIPFRIKGTE